MDKLIIWFIIDVSFQKDASLHEKTLLKVYIYKQEVVLESVWLIEQYVKINKKRSPMKFNMNIIWSVVMLKTNIWQC